MHIDNIIVFICIQHRKGLMEISTSPFSRTDTIRRNR